VAEPLRVLELLVSTDPGGGPAHVRELAARLPRDEFEVTVAGPGGGAYAGDLSIGHGGFVEVPANRLSLRALLAVRRLVRDRRIGLVHSHGKGAGLYGRLVARRAGIPAIHTFHGIHYAGYGPLAALYLAMERRLAAMSAAIVHVSESQAGEAGPLGLCPSGRTRVIDNGVDAARVRARLQPRSAARRALGLDAGDLVIGTIARFDPVKAVDALLTAFAQVLRERPLARLALVGDGSESARLRALARTLRIQDRVSFAGSLPEAARLLSALDVYASASRREGLPLALLEAMACGLPVVATCAPGHVDVVDDGGTGVLVPPDDVAALAQAMGDLLDDPARRAVLGDAGRRRVEDRFGVERMTSETAALYRAVAARFPGGPSQTSGV
jgi:glycosyltransferase involved in cell wall biosynthesis